MILEGTMQASKGDKPPLPYPSMIYSKDQHTTEGMQ